MKLKEPIATLKPSELKMEGKCREKDTKSAKKRSSAKKTQLKMKLY